MPATFSAGVDVANAVWDPSRECLRPGSAFCISDAAEFTVEAAGLFEFSIPFTCECLDVSSPYFLSFHVTTVFPETGRPDLLTDEAPLGCTSWNDFGSGWIDLVTENELPGEIIIRASAECCDDPLDAENKNWGDIKSLYR